MDHKARYQALVEFLLPYQDIWRNEIMLQYPDPVGPYPADWIKELRAHLSPEKTYELAQGNGWSKLAAAGLREFHERILALTELPAAPSYPSVPATAMSWVKIIPKKQHEIQRLAPLIAAKMSGRSSIVDIGGGQGHLAQTLAHHYGFKVLSLDMDSELQQTGQHWQKEKWPESPHLVRFHTHRLVRNDEVFAKMLDHQTLTTGLHTCGPLALAHLEAALLADAPVVNMPCCYHKLAPREASCSGLARWYALPWNQFALTLATGAHRKATLSDVAFRMKVKRFRYALHFLLHDEFDRPGHLTLGNCPPALYDGEFALYAREQFERLGLSPHLTDAELNRYFAQKKVQSTIDDMLAATIIRDAFGRALEVALLCDRAVWLEEEGCAVEILELFDAKISPRNIVFVVLP